MSGRVGAVGRVAFARIGKGFISSGVGIARIGDLGMLSGRAPYITIAFEDFFSGNIGGIVKQRRVVEDRLEVLWYLQHYRQVSNLTEAR